MMISTVISVVYCVAYWLMMSTVLGRKIQYFNVHFISCSSQWPANIIYQSINNISLQIIDSFLIYYKAAKVVAAILEGGESYLVTLLRY